MARKERDTDGNTAREVGGASTRRPLDAQFRGYINLELSDLEKADWEAWALTPEVWWCLNIQVEKGVNLSVKMDPKGSAALASATQRDPASPNAGLVVTARGRTPWIALTRVIWCLLVLDRTESWEDTQPLANPDRW